MKKHKTQSKQRETISIIQHGTQSPITPFLLQLALIFVVEMPRGNSSCLRWRRVAGEPGSGEISFWKPAIRRGRRARSGGEVLPRAWCGDRAREAGVEAWNSPWLHDRGEAYWEQICVVGLQAEVFLGANSWVNGAEVISGRGKFLGRPSVILIGLL
jgi:hypothetical protein